MKAADPKIEARVRQSLDGDVERLRRIERAQSIEIRALAHYLSALEALLPAEEKVMR